MIGFFRRIRKKLTDDNQFLKYSRYAIGEILLVVIGILIALQVNNWNENRKTKIAEKKILKELRSDLAQNLFDIEGNIDYLNDCKISNEIILYHIDNKTPYNDSLNYHFSNLFPYITFNVNQTSYESLKLQGFNLISNDSLRIIISDLYANKFESYRKFENTYLIEHHNNEIKPMYISEFTSFKHKTSTKPKNYNQFINTPKYREIIFWTAEMCKDFTRIQSALKENVIDLIDNIDKEIEK